MADFRVVEELKKKESGARPGSGRAFLRCTSLAVPGLQAQLTFWSLLAAGVGLDLWTKEAVFEWLQRRGSVSIVDGFLQLVLAENAGAAFGIATGRRHLLVAVSAVALAVILAVFFFSGTERKFVHIALGLFAAGVAGNLYDRIFNHGLVRDFIDVYYRHYHWPAFNVADSMLCIGVGLMVISCRGMPSRPAWHSVSRSTGKSFQKRAQPHK